MKEKLLDLLACPDCYGPLEIKDGKTENGEIKEGSLVCGKCSASFRIVDFIPRFVETDKYVGNFSFEWKKHRLTQLDSANKTVETEETFKEKTGFDLNSLKGKFVLDAGCGMGRFMEVVNKYGGEAVGFDLSLAVEAAFDNIGLKPGCHIIQADVFKLPFKKEAFDYIFSIGVLHHTPDTGKAFSQLVPLLKKGGKIAIWVYSSHLMVTHFFSDIYRKVTTHLPIWLLYPFSYTAIFYYYLVKMPFIGKFFLFLLPISCDSKWRWRVLDTFDWYSPKYQWKHSYPEVYDWFTESQLGNIRLLKMPVSIYGEKSR
ncbi:MAG: methyltransferase domain-containing protein [Planctomycetota bacterium]